MCPIYFRECHEVLSPYADPDNYTQEQVAVVGTYPCRDLCWDHTLYCDSSIPAELREVFYNCDVPNPYYFDLTIYDVLPEGPDVTMEVSAPNGDTWDYDFQCYEDSREISYLGAFNCPQGMHQSGVDSCAFNCPEPLLEKDEFDIITDMMSGISWISLVMMAFLILTYLVDPTKRKFPNHLPMFFFIAIMCFSFAFCLASMLSDGTEEMLCENEENPNYFGAGACTVQGILVVYFFMAAVLWWLVICVNIFLMLIFAARSIDWKKGSTRTAMMVCYHCIAWLLPLIPVIIGLGAERLGANGSDLWCTIHSTDEDNALEFFIGRGDGIEAEGETTNVWNFVLFWLPILLCVFIGVSLILVVIIFQLRQESGVKGFWTFVKGQWRIFAFLGLYIWVCIFLFAFQLDFLNRRNDQYDAYERHIQCLFEKTAMEYYWEHIEQRPVPDDEAVRCSTPSEINYPLWVLAAFNFAGQGIFVFFIFGTSRRIYLVWWRIFTCRSPLSSTTGSSSDISMDRPDSGAKKTGKVTRVQGKKLDAIKGDSDADSL
ncbi:G-protein coupled receptor Fz Smo [Balamuthia mandrillaris]